MLVDDKNVMFSSTFKRTGKSIIFQVVKNNIAFERSHVLVNSANTHLMHGATVALAIVKEGGLTIQNESNQYVANNGPLSVGEVISASPGNLRCLQLFHSVPPRWGVDQPEEELIHKVVSDTLLLADKYMYKSISIPAFSCGKFSNGSASIKKSVKSIFTTIFKCSTELQYLDIIRVVTIDTDTIHQLINAITSLQEKNPSFFEAKA